MAKERDTAVDTLRALSLICMLISHTSPGHFILQLREFDVPLMILLSGVSFSISSTRNDALGISVKYPQFLWKRTKRLVLSAWAFLFVYFVLLHTSVLITGIDYEINPGSILGFFTFQTGWYVRIIRVFFIVAVFAPFLYKVAKKVKPVYLLLACLCLFILFDLCNLQVEYSVKYFELMVIPYLAVFTIGCIVNRLSTKTLLWLAFVSAVIFTIIGVELYLQEGRFVLTGEYKYPPHLYYISYAMAISFALYAFKGTVGNVLSSRALGWIGSHSLWVYFWHIIPLTALRLLSSNGFHGIPWYLSFFIVFISAVGITYAQTCLVRYICSRMSNERAKKNLRLVFEG